MKTCLKKKKHKKPDDSIQLIIVQPSVAWSSYFNLGCLKHSLPVAATSHLCDLREEIPPSYFASKC